MAYVVFIRPKGSILSLKDKWCGHGVNIWHYTCQPRMADRN